MTKQLQNARILIVDDDDVILEMASAVLGKAGHTCLTAKDGGQGLTMAQKERPDLIIMDRAMPIMNGTQAIANLNKGSMTASIPIIMLTGSSESESVKQCLSLGVDDYIIKPFVPNDLTQRVERVLKGFSRSRKS